MFLSNSSSRTHAQFTCEACFYCSSNARHIFVCPACPGPGNVVGRGRYMLCQICFQHVACRYCHRRPDVTDIWSDPDLVQSRTSAPISSPQFESSGEAHASQLGQTATSCTKATPHLVMPLPTLGVDEDIIIEWPDLSFVADDEMDEHIGTALRRYGLDTSTGHWCPVSVNGVVLPANKLEELLFEKGCAALSVRYINVDKHLQIMNQIHTHRFGEDVVWSNWRLIGWEHMILPQGASGDDIYDAFRWSLSKDCMTFSRFESQREKQFARSIELQWHAFERLCRGMPLPLKLRKHGFFNSFFDSLRLRMALDRGLPMTSFVADQVQRTWVLLRSLQLRLNRQSSRSFFCPSDDSLSKMHCRFHAATYVGFLTGQLFERLRSKDTSDRALKVSHHTNSVESIWESCSHKVFTESQWIGFEEGHSTQQWDDNAGFEGKLTRLCRDDLNAMHAWILRIPYNMEARRIVSWICAACIERLYVKAATEESAALENQPLLVSTPGFGRESEDDHDV